MNNVGEHQAAKVRRDCCVVRGGWGGGANGTFELVDTGNAKLSGTHSFGPGNVLSLIWDGTGWAEVSFSAKLMQDVGRRAVGRCLPATRPCPRSNRTSRGLSGPKASLRWSGAFLGGRSNGQPAALPRRHARP